MEWARKRTWVPKCKGIEFAESCKQKAKEWHVLHLFTQKVISKGHRIIFIFHRYKKVKVEVVFNQRKQCFTWIERSFCDNWEDNMQKVWAEGVVKLTIFLNRGRNVHKWWFRLTPCSNTTAVCRSFSVWWLLFGTWVTNIPSICKGLNVPVEY